MKRAPALARVVLVVRVVRVVRVVLVVLGLAACGRSAGEDEICRAIDPASDIVARARHAETAGLADKIDKLRAKLPAANDDGQSEIRREGVHVRSALVALEQQVGRVDRARRGDDATKARREIEALRRASRRLSDSVGDLAAVCD